MLRNGILTDPYTHPIMAYDAALGSPGRPHAAHKTAKDTKDSPHLRVPGDLSDAWELRTNPSYAKTLRDNDIKTRAPLPAEDDDTMTDERIQKMAKALKEQLQPDELAALIAAIGAASEDEDVPATDEGDPSTHADTNAKRNALGIDAVLAFSQRYGKRIAYTPEMAATATFDLRGNTDGFRFGKVAT